MIKMDRFEENALAFFYPGFETLNFQFPCYRFVLFCFVFFFLTNKPLKLDRSDNLPVGPLGT